MFRVEPGVGRTRREGPSFLSLEVQVRHLLQNIHYWGVISVRKEASAL